MQRDIFIFQKGDEPFVNLIFIYFLKKYVINEVQN